MIKYKIYEVDIGMRFMTNSNCLVSARSKKEALEVAQEVMPTTRLNINHIKEIEINKAQVIMQK